LFDGSDGKQKRSIEEFSSVGSVAAKWTIRVPAVPIAIIVSAGVWDNFLVTAPESRTKALLKEGEVVGLPNPLKC
jgi:hypothetical protein